MSMKKSFNLNSSIQLKKSSCSSLKNESHISHSSSDTKGERNVLKEKDVLDHFEADLEVRI